MRGNHDFAELEDAIDRCSALAQPEHAGAEEGSAPHTCVTEFANDPECGPQVLWEVGLANRAESLNGVIGAILNFPLPRASSSTLSRSR